MKISTLPGLDSMYQGNQFSKISDRSINYQTAARFNTTGTKGDSDLRHEELKTIAERFLAGSQAEANLVTPKKIARDAETKKSGLQLLVSSLKEIKQFISGATTVGASANQVVFPNAGSQAHGGKANNDAKGLTQAEARTAYTALITRINAELLNKGKSAGANLMVEPLKPGTSGTLRGASYDLGNAKAEATTVGSETGIAYDQINNGTFQLENGNAVISGANSDVGILSDIKKLDANLDAVIQFAGDIIDSLNSTIIAEDTMFNLAVKQEENTLAHCVQEILLTYRNFSPEEVKAIIEMEEYQSMNKIEEQFTQVVKSDRFLKLLQNTLMRAQ
jgi:hypothetical protein